MIIKQIQIELHIILNRNSQTVFKQVEQSQIVKHSKKESNKN